MGTAFKKVKKGLNQTKCTDEVIEKICNAIRYGNFIETAVILAGVSKNTFYNWIKYADKKHTHYKPIYAALRDAVEIAQEEATARDLMNIDRCAMGQEPEYMRNEDGGIIFDEHGKPIVLKMGVRPDWQASKWRIGLRNPDKWSETKKVELTGKGGEPLNKPAMTSEEIAKRLAEIKSKLNEPV